MDTPDSTTLKRCPKCGETKPRDQFSKKKSSADGLCVWCKACGAAYSRQYNADHRDDVRIRSEARRRKTRAAKQAYDRQYLETNRDRINERQRRRYAENREAILESRRLVRGELREKERLRRIAHPDIFRANKHRRRAREKLASGTCTAADIAAIRAAQTDKKGRLLCWKCGKPIKDTPHLDHWIPIKQGGPSDPGNLHFMHERCNKSKGAKHPTEIGRLL